MNKTIIRFIREYIFGISIILFIFGLFLLFVGAVWFWFKESAQEGILRFIYDFDDWNIYVFIAGLILFFLGLYYIYSYRKNKKFVMEELQTNKRSEFMKRHTEIKSIVKRLPSKYQQMFKEKEEELKIK